MATGQLDYVLRHLRALIGRQTAAAHADGVLLDRFLADRDEDAFATLLQRHGPLVWSVCRRVLGDGPDAEDAFQAAFLVLVRRARTLDRTQPLGPWLFGVAQKIAVRAKSDAARRHTREQQGFNMALLDHATEQTWNDLRPVLDEELAKLPEKYRAPLVLCDLQGKTHEQAALELGWPVGSMSRRLSRGRELLRKRLVKRGLKLSAGVLAATLTRATASAAVPPTLAMTTTQAALMTAAGQAAGVASVHALQLAEGVTHMVWLTKTKIAVAAAVVMAMTLAAGGTGVWLQRSWKKDQVVAQGKEHTEKEKGTEAEKPKEKVAEPPPKDDSKTEDEEKPNEPRANDLNGLSLPFGAVRRMGTMHLGWPSWPTAVALSDDTRLLAAFGGARQLAVWSLPSGRLLWQLRLPNERLLNYQGNCLVFSPNGKQLVTPVGAVEADTGVRLPWNMLPNEDKGHFIASAAFSSDGKVLATNDGGERIDLRDTSTGLVTRRLNLAHFSWAEVIALAFSPDGDTLAAIEAEDRSSKPPYGWLTFYDLAEKDANQPSKTLKGKFTHLAFSSDGKTVFASAENRIHVFDAKTRKESKVLKANNSPIVQFVVSSDNETVISLGLDRGIRVQNVSGSENKLIPDKQDDPRSSFALGQDGKTLAIGYRTGRIRFSDLTSRKITQDGAGHTKAITSVAFSRDCKALATGSADQTIRFWDPATGDELRKPYSAQDKVRCISYSPDGQSVAVLGDRVQLFDSATANEKATFGKSGRDYRSLAFSPDGKLLAVVGLGFPIEIYNLETKKEDFTLERRKIGTQGGTCVAWSPNGKMLASGTTPSQETLQVREGLLGVWTSDFKGAAPLEFGGRPFRSDGSINVVAFSPDSEILAYAEDKMISLVDPSTRKLSRRLDGHEKPVTCLAFASDGRVLASGSEDGTIWLWETLTGEPIRTFDGHQLGVTSVSFAPDSRRLASGSADGTALVWDVYGPVIANRRLQDKLTPENLDEYWADLSGRNPARAYHAISALVNAPKQSLSYLKLHLHYQSPDEKRIAQLIEDLLDELPPECDKAYQELTDLEDLALDAVRDALKKSPSDFVRKRLERIIEYRENGVHLTPSGPRLRILRALAVLELIATDDAKAILQSLAKGNPKDPVVREAKAVLGRMK
jgi:RNA polymerase sigma factor (sigma-70 family)